MPRVGEIAPDGAGHGVIEAAAGDERDDRGDDEDRGRRFAQVRERLGMVRNIQGDMVERVQQGEFDFAHFSNIVDYLPEASLHRLFGACAAEGAPCFFIETTACPDREALARAWQAQGLRLHPASEEISASNCALGCRTSVRHWMRTGAVSLLLPASLTDNPRG